MTKKIKYPKLILYCASVIFLWMVIYNFTWANTLQLNSEIALINAELNDFELNKQNSEVLDLIILPESQTNDSLDFQHEILAIITKTLESKKAQIHQFSEVQKVKSEELEVQIQPVIIQGDFFSLLAALSELEQNYQHLNIASANLFVKKNKKNKRNELFLKIYVQKLI